MKKLRYLLLTVLLFGMLMPLLTSCIQNLTGEQTAIAFLDCIKRRDFATAYLYTYTNTNRDDFVSAYENFFDVFDVESMEYSVSDKYDQNTYAELKCSFTYKSASYDDITEDMTIEVYKRGNRFFVKWTPALILSEMEEGDYVQKVTLGAKRGDIIADHVVLAETVPQKAISINVTLSDKHTKEDIDEAAQIVAEKLSIPVDEVISKLQYHIIFNTKPKSDTKLDKKGIAADIKEAARILGITEQSISEAINTAPKSDADALAVKAEIATFMAYDLPDETRKELQKLSHIQVQSSIYFGIALIGEYHATRIDKSILDDLANADKRLGIIVSDSSVSTSRYYPNDSMLAHVLGYMGSMSAEDAEETAEKYNEGRTETDGLYTKYSVVGTSGLEYKYETELRGKDGYRVYICGKDGGNKRTLYEKKPENGLDIQLTIDYELQKKAEALIKNTVYGEVTGGAVIVMNPETGAVEAMASYPDYNLNLFSTGISREEYDELSKVKGTFTNKAIQGTFIPGSVIKAVTASAALTYNVVKTDYIFDGEIINDTWRIPEKYGPTAATDRIKRDKVKRRNEPLNMRNAFVHSDNIYFANIMLKMGDNRFEEFWNTLGLNEAIDFDLRVSQSQYKNKDKDSERNIITIAETGFGQGTMLVTPLQLACTYCAFANRGSVPVPYIVEGLYHDTDEGYRAQSRTTPRMWRENVIRKDICDDITEMLKDVASPLYNGTASQLRVKSCTVAGKTGTAQTTKGRNNSWFIGYRTGVSEKDERLVLVLLEVPSDSEYSSLKLDIARELLELK